MTDWGVPIPHFRIDALPDVHALPFGVYRKGSYRTVTGTTKWVWTLLRTFETVEQARAFVKAIKDLPEYH